MTCFHKEYSLGDQRAENIEKYSSWEEWLKGEVLEPNGEDNVIFLPLYLYDHGGITIRTYPFSCSWDSGQVGWIWVTRKQVKEFLGEGVTDGEVREFLKEEVKIYDQYIVGDIFGYVLEGKIKCPECGHIEYDLKDSCWGFYGSESIKGMLDALSHDYKLGELVEKIKSRL